MSEDRRRTLDPGRFRPQPTLTPLQAARRAGVDVDDARRLRRALGLPELAVDAVECDEDDVAVLEGVREITEAGVPFDDVVSIGRVHGQAFARIADAETRFFERHFVEPLRKQGRGLAEMEELLEPRVARLLELLGSSLDYVHRRHLAPALSNLTASGGGDAETTAVCFVDLVDFSSISDEMAAPDLSHLIERFEQLMIEACADAGVRVVKTIGDAVMFVSADAPLALQVARRIVERAEEDPSLPQARAGLDLGPVVPVGGDYFGRHVNVAARATAFAHPARSSRPRRYSTLSPSGPTPRTSAATPSRAWAASTSSRSGTRGR